MLTLCPLRQGLIFKVGTGFKEVLVDSDLLKMLIWRWEIWGTIGRIILLKEVLLLE